MRKEKKKASNKNTIDDKTNKQMDLWTREVSHEDDEYATVFLSQ